MSDEEPKLTGRVLKVDLTDREVVCKTLMELVDLIQTAMESHQAIGSALAKGEIEIAKTTAKLGFYALQARKSELFGEAVELPPEVLEDIEAGMAKLGLSRTKRKKDPRFNH